MTTEQFVERLESGVASYRKARRRRLNRIPSGDTASGDIGSGRRVTTKTIMAGSDEFETTLYEIDSGVPGPTGFVLAGQHGNEPAGWLGAENLLETTPETGTLVVIPRADQKSIAEGTWGNSGFNLNREWNIDGTPNVELARAIWEQVRAYDPDVVLDLHSSKGILREDEGPDGVGQALFPTPNARSAAATVVDELNDEYLYPAGYGDTFRFRVGNDQDGSYRDGKFMHKVGYELDATGFLFETTRYETTLEEREEWTTAAAVKMLREGGLDVE